MDASGQNYKDIFRYTDVEYTPEGHTDVYRWDDFLGIAGGHVLSAKCIVDSVSPGGEFEGDEPEYAYACEIVGCCGLSDGVALLRPVSHGGNDLIQIAFLRNDTDDATGAYTERFEAGSFDIPSTDLPCSEFGVDLLEYFSGRSFEGVPGVSRGLDPHEAVDSIEDAIGCDLGLFDSFWLGVPGEADMRVGPYSKKSLLDFSYYAKELSCRYGLADSDILEIARRLPEECPNRFAAVKAYLDCEYVPDGDAPDEKTYRWGDFFEIAGGDARYAAMLVDRTAAGEPEEGLHPETLVDQDIRDGEAFMLAGRPSPESARRQANIKRSVKSIDKCISAQKDEFKRLKAKVDKHLSYSRIIAPKGGINGIKAYLASSYYKKRNLPRSARKKILDAAAANEELCRLEGIKANLKDKLAPEEPIELRDFKFDLHRYSPSFDYLGIVILGNHEYVGFPDVNAAVAFYKESLEPLGYAVLQNECIEDDRCVIYGGTGFAAHNERYNATNLVCCDAMTVDRGLFAMAAQGLPGAEAELKEAKARARAYEVEQTRLFAEGYEAARERARKAGKCFICASHYPAEDCLGRIDRDAVYFSGHTHQNRYLRSENAVIYADNQVGYHKRGGFDPRWDMRFKRATTGCARNPYADLADGCYPTTADEYLSFYRFIGEYAGTGKMIRQRCEKNDMHVIKSNGYYGFFLVGENGTSIVNGGKTKRVSTHRDIKWAHDNFDTVVSKYLAALAPLRERQEQVSGELKRLGFSGNIHGLIVDVNFSHHIMVNPADGSLVFYYSPEYGWVGTFDSFPKLLEHVKDSEQLHIDMNPLYALQAGDTPTRCDVALERYDAGVLAPSPSMALAPASIEGVEVLEKSEGRDLDRLVNVDLEHGAYKLSRDVAPLQRLFSKHVLRNFDARLAELDDGSAARRTKSMAGRVFKDEFGMMWLIVGDDLGEFVDALDQDGKERRVTVLALRKLVATQGDGRWLTKSLDETESAFKGRYQPKAWRGALPSLRLRDLSAGE